MLTNCFAISIPPNYRNDFKEFPVFFFPFTNQPQISYTFWMNIIMRYQKKSIEPIFEPWIFIPTKHPNPTRNNQEAFPGTHHVLHGSIKESRQIWIRTYNNENYANYKIYPSSSISTPEILVIFYYLLRTQSSNNLKLPSNYLLLQTHSVHLWRYRMPLS